MDSAISVASSTRLYPVTSAITSAARWMASRECPSSAVASRMLSSTFTPCQLMIPPPDVPGASARLRPPCRINRRNQSGADKLGRAPLADARRDGERRRRGRGQAGAITWKQADKISRRAARDGSPKGLRDAALIAVASDLCARGARRTHAPSLAEIG